MPRNYFLAWTCAAILFGQRVIANPFQSTHEEDFYAALNAGNVSAAEQSFAEILKTPKKFQYLDEYRKEDLQVYLQTIACSPAEPDLVLSIAFIYVGEIEASYNQPQKGRLVPVKVHGAYSEAATKGIKESVELFSKFYACSPDLRIRFVPTFIQAPQIKLTEIRAVPFRESGQITLKLPLRENAAVQTFIGENLDHFDIFVFVIPSEQRGMSAATLAEFKSSTGKKVRRGLVNIGIERIRVTQTLIHEIFHVIEQAGGNRKFHLYEQKQKAAWPSWYTGDGQLNFYRGFLKALRDSGRSSVLNWR